jgi:hypothetical protein
LSYRVAAFLLLAAGLATAAEPAVLMAPATAQRLLEAKVGQRIALAAAPSKAGTQAPVVLERIDVYAADARVYVLGERGPVEVPRSSNLNFISVEGPRIALSVDPASGAGEGLLIAEDGRNYALTVRAQAGSLALAIERRADLTPDGEALDFGYAMGNDARTPTAAQLAAIAVPAGDATISAIDAPDVASRQAVIAVDTDNELMSLKFGNNATSATNYIAALFANMNLIYERDLDLTVVQGTTLLRPSSVTDPYNSTSATDTSDQLDEFGIWWRDNQNPVSRAFVLLLSGKSNNTNVSSGIAWLVSSGLYCNAKGSAGSSNVFGHYGLNRVFRFNGATASSDALVTSHEVGHNLGASHTHCTSAATGNYDTGSNTIDQCYSGEASSGCFAGPQSCPAPQTINGVTNVTGTLMSYCHVSGVAQCDAALVFAPIQQQRLRERITTNFQGGCITPIGSTNLAPTLNAPSTIAAAEDQAATITGVSFGDADAGSDTLTATFTIAEGALNAGAVAGITVGGSANARTLRGALAVLNTYLQAGNLVYQPLANANGNRSLSILIDDEGHNGNGGPRTASGSSTIAIAAVNDAPVLGVPATFAATEDATATLSGIGLTDVDSSAGNLTVTMTVEQGTLVAPPAAGVAISGSPGASVVLTGTATALTAYLAAPNMRYTPVANFSGNLNLTVTANDGGNSGSGGARTDTEVPVLQVAAVNDSPTLTAPQQIPITLIGSGPISGIVAGDIDVASGSMTQTLSVPEGTLAASSQGGVSVVGSGTQNLVLSGTLAALNGFYAPTPRVTYTQAASPSLSIPLSIQISDNGGSGSGGARTASASITLRTGILLMDSFE